MGMPFLQKLFLCFLLCYTPWQMDLSRNSDITIIGSACEV